MSDVSENQAIEMLAACRYFSDFDFQQLIILARELTVVHFRAGETVLFQGEPATFFGVVLKGSLVPVVGDQVMGRERGVGDVVGEMALFSGGTRNVSIVAAHDGYLAVFAFAHLERLQHSDTALATKLSRQLAVAALEKQLEADGRSLDMLSPIELENGVDGLIQRQAQQQRDRACAPSSTHCVLCLAPRASRPAHSRRGASSPAHHPHSHGTCRCR